jgi:hypothetical protein
MAKYYEKQTDLLCDLNDNRVMTKQEALREGQFLGKVCRIVYDEHYLPNCKEEPVKATGFFMSKEFMDTIKNISKEETEGIRERAKN